MIKYSVIIPHKNCPELLSRCLKSIPYSNEIEVIVVDDNSDNIEKLKFQQYSCPDNVRFVYTKDGKGAGHARNVGLSFATGDWLIFADADDFFAKNAFEIFAKYKNSEYGIVYFKHDSVFSDSLKPCQRYNVRNGLIEACQEAMNPENEARLRYKDVVPWSKMFRRSISVDFDIVFDEVPSSNDVMFVVQNAFKAKKIYASNEIVYTTTYREGSITRQINKVNNKSRFKVSLRYNKFMDSIGYPEFKIRVLSHVMLAFRKFGIREAIRYVHIVHQNNQTLFTGGMPNIKDLLSKALTRKKSDIFRG